MKIIGLTGAKGAGKTTVFNIIKKQKDSVYEITLASKLKDVCSTATKIPRSHFDRQDKKEQALDSPVYLTKELILELFSGFSVDNPDFNKFVRPHIGKILETPRGVAQYVGTEVLRNYNSDIHCEAAVKGFYDSGCSIGVVTDMRFMNEAEYFTTRYPDTTTLVYVQNSSAETKSDEDNHISERGYQEIRMKALKIVNEFSIDELGQQVYTLLSKIGA